MNNEERIKKLLKVIFQTRCELESIIQQSKLIECKDIAYELIYWLDKVIKEQSNEEGKDEDKIQSNSYR